MAADFDPLSFVTEYRQIIEKRDQATTAIDRDEFERIAVGMRWKWQTWQGEDSLHEMAFGEPPE